MIWVDPSSHKVHEHITRLTWKSSYKELFYLLVAASERGIYKTFAIIIFLYPQSVNSRILTEMPSSSSDCWGTTTKFEMLHISAFAHGSPLKRMLYEAILEFNLHSLGPFKWEDYYLSLLPALTGPPAFALAPSLRGLGILHF